jgi:parafibromin
MLPSIDPNTAQRFAVLDTPDQFKHEYWRRVVAVFTTGQVWQFKAYRWSDPPELFRNTLGIYVGWRGEEPPSTVKGWGRGVMTTAIDKWNAGAGSAGRWRDREVVEQIWGAIEETMRSRGWSKEGLTR